MSRFSKISFAALAVTLIAAGCVERPPRSFVQPNVIKKSDLTGTWHYVQTVTDAPVSNGNWFTGYSSELMKIKFDIQENTLFARRAYEQILGSEDAAAKDPQRYAGQPLAAWPIQSQFDIIRDYNATTGEETNRIIESTERAWNQREFIRVDWSQNVLVGNDVVGLGINFFFSDGVSVQPGTYWESDPSKPDAFHMERADESDASEFAAGEANYFDVTNKWVVNPTPLTLTFEENGVKESVTYPACFLRYRLEDCASQLIKVRHGFAKISPKHDYQPREWDGRQMELFGLFDTASANLSFNRQYGVTNTGFKRYAARFNLWKKSYEDDGKTPIAHVDREQRTIPYYAMSSLDPFPVDLFDLGKEVVRQWNDAVKVAVKDVTGKPMEEVKDVFVFCHNPVKLREDSMGPADDAACRSNIKPKRDALGNVIKDENGDPIYYARKGDPRRSNIFWVNQQQNGGPLGYGPGLSDPQTGETISGQANLYGAALDTYAAASRDLVLLLLGRLDPADFIAGTNVKDWVAANRGGRTDMPETRTPEEVRERVHAMDFSWARGLAPEAPIDGSDMKNFMRSLTDRQNAIYKSGIFGQGEANLGELKRKRLQGKPIEGRMITTDLISMAGAQPGMDWTALGDNEKARVSPLRSATVRRHIEDRMNRMRALGWDFADFADDVMVQRAIKLSNDPKTANMDPEVIRQALRRDIFVGLTLHEMGHSVGLRHNFRGSYDAMNYHPQYWTLRNAAATNPQAKKYGGFDLGTGQPIARNYAGTDCSGPKRGKIRPRWVDCPGGALSVDEVVNQVGEYQYSSIMEYGSTFNHAEFHGLGLYDKAAMKFSYAGDGYVEVFTDVISDSPTQLKMAALHAFQGSYGFPSPLGLGDQPTSINYNTYPSLFKSGVEGIYKRKDVPYRSLEQIGPGGYIKAEPGTGNPLVPYYFCSDEFVGNLTCQRYDNGASPYDVVKDIASRYNNLYIVNNFKRDRYSFYSSLGYWDRIGSRYFEPVRTPMTWYSLLRPLLEEFFERNAFNVFWDDEDGWGDFGMAVTEGFDMIGNAIGAPEAGSYRLVNAAQNTEYPVQMYKQASDGLDGGPGQIVIGLIDGKYGTTTWDFDECGYFWSDNCQSRIGFFLDKIIAIDYLTQSTARFTGYDTTTDVRRYSIGYITAFRQQVEEKVGALMSGQFASYGPSVQMVAGKPDIKRPSWTLGTTQTAPPAGTTLMDPATGFTLQMYMGVYGLSEFPTTFDRTFVDTTRIFVLGNGEAPVPDSVIQPACTTAGGTANGWYCITDNDTGKMYASKVFPVENGKRTDTGVRMLETYATMLGQRTTACAAPTSADCTMNKLKVDKYRQNLDVMRALHNAFGYGTYKVDDPFLY